MIKGRVWRRAMQVIGLFIILGLGFFSYKGNQSQNMVIESTLNENQLGKCGPKPNCVSSFQKKDEPSYITPYPVSFFSFKKADTYFKDCSIKSQSEFYRHYNCSSRVFKFVDDLEIYFYNAQLYFRSASRVGHSDLGSNRKRVEGFKEFIKKGL